MLKGGGGVGSTDSTIKNLGRVSKRRTEEKKVGLASNGKTAGKNDPHLCAKGSRRKSRGCDCGRKGASPIWGRCKGGASPIWREGDVRGENKWRGPPCGEVPRRWAEVFR